MLSYRTKSALRYVAPRSIQRVHVACAHSAPASSSSLAQSGGLRKALFGGARPSTILFGGERHIAPSAIVPHSDRSTYHHRMLPFEIAKVFDVLDSLPPPARNHLILTRSYKALDAEEEEVSEGDWNLFADFRTWASTLDTKDTVEYFDAALSESGIQASKQYRPWVEVEEINGETWDEMKIGMGMYPEADEQDLHGEERPMKSVEGDEEAVNAAWPHEVQPESPSHTVTIERTSDSIDQLMSHAIENGHPYKLEERFTVTRPGPDGKTTSITTSKSPLGSFTHIEGPEADEFEFDDPEDDPDHPSNTINRISMVVKSPYPFVVDTGSAKAYSFPDPNEDGDHVLQVERSGKNSPVIIKIREGHADEYPIEEDEEEEEEEEEE